MKEPENTLKVRLKSSELAVGIWCSLSSSLTTEVVAGSGADWLLIDGEHSPNNLRSIVAQLQVTAGFSLEAVVRLPSDDPNLIKQYMDAGARSLMIPNVRTESQARAIVSSTQYAPAGIRGFSTGHRANQFGRYENYHQTARENQLLVLQIECLSGVENASEIAAVDGVDALFVGPGDLSTNMGAMGSPGNQEVQEAIEEVVRATQSAGKAIGILAPLRVDADRYISMGCILMAVGADLGLLARGSDNLVDSFRN